MKKQNTVKKVRINSMKRDAKVNFLLSKGITPKSIDNSDLNKLILSKVKSEEIGGDYSKQTIYLPK